MDLDKLQEYADKFYEKYGANDEVIGLQLLINRERAIRDEPDKKESVYEDFSQ